MTITSDDLTDLKQFIQITVTDAVTRSEMRIVDILTDTIEERLDEAKEELRAEIDELRQETRKGFTDTTQSLIDVIDTNHTDQEKRITKLERRLATP